MGQSGKGTGGDLEESSVFVEFERLELRPLPAAGELDTLVRHALLLSHPQLATRARELIQRWRAAGCKDPELQVFEMLLSVYGSSSSARHRLAAIGNRSPQASAMEAINCLFRGELRGAVELAHAHGWFLDSVEATEVMCYALAAAALNGQFAEAEVIIDAWKRRYAASAPEKYLMVLQVESRVAYWQLQFARELALLEDADALCREHDLTTTQQFMQPALAGAYVHCGERRAADRIMAGWASDGEGATSPLECFRNMVRVDVALLDERYDDAWRAATKMLEFTTTISGIPVICESRFYRALTASADALAEELEAYRRMAYLYQIRRHLERVKVLEQLVDAGYTTLRDAQVEVRSRRGRELYPLFRLWLPKIEWIGADLYADRGHGVVYLGNHGPHSLAAHPVLRRVVEEIVTSPNFSLGMEDLFPLVWGGPFDALRHEGKVHVTIHRLRHWLDECRPGSSTLLEIQDGIVRLAPSADVRVMALERVEMAPGEAGASGAKERLLQCLSGGEWMSPKELEQRVGISRSSLNQTMRILIAEGRVVREGQGRKTRYQRVPPDPR